MWDTVRVDHGTEFYLTLFMQEKNASKRFNTDRTSYIQSQSKQVLKHTYTKLLVPLLYCVSNEVVIDKSAV